MNTLLDRIRSELTARRAELAAELQEVDEALSKIGVPPEPTFADQSRNGSTDSPRLHTGGRRPSEKSMRIDTWIRSWAPNLPGQLVVADDAFRQAVALGLVENERKGRERVRLVLERMVRNKEAENFGGGRYRVIGEVAQP